MAGEAPLATLLRPGWKLPAGHFTVSQHFLPSSLCNWLTLTLGDLAGSAAAYKKNNKSK